MDFVDVLEDAIRAAHECGISPAAIEAWQMKCGRRAEDAEYAIRRLLIFSDFSAVRRELANDPTATRHLTSKQYPGVVLLVEQRGVADVMFAASPRLQHTPPARGRNPGGSTTATSRATGAARLHT